MADHNTPDGEDRALGAGDTIVALVGDAAVRRSVVDGEELCRQGEPSAEAYAVLSGVVSSWVDDGDRHAAFVVARHEAGDLVGELTSLVGGARTATLRAEGPVEVAVISRDTLLGALEAHPDEVGGILAEARTRVDRTRVAEVLTELLGDHEVAHELAREMPVAVVDRGVELMREGDPPDGMAVLLAGRVEIVKAVHGVDEAAGDSWVGEERVGERGRGDTVGEIGLLDHKPRRATVRALRQTTVARLSDDSFRRVVERHPALALALARRALTASDRQPSEVRPVSVVAVAAVGDLGDARIVDTLASEVARHASCSHLTAASVDATLGREGAADADPGSWIGAGLAEVFHDADASHDHVLLELEPEREAWTRRALDCADSVIVHLRADADADAIAEAARITTLAPELAQRWLVLHHPAGTDRPRGSAALRQQVGADEVHHVAAERSDADLARIARLATGHGVGLVLGGGGARGFAHLGAMRALREFEVPVDRIIGASIGAVLGAATAKGLDPDALQDVCRRRFRRLLDYTLPIVSLLRGRRIEAALDAEFDEWDIDDLWVPYRCVSTNLTRSRSEVHRHGPVDVAVRASIAIPGVLAPVPLDGDLLIDGGVLANLPVQVLADDASVGTVIAVDVAPEMGPRARAEYPTTVSGWRVVGGRTLRRPDPYPRLGAILTRTMLVGAARTRSLHLEAGAVDLLLDLDLRGVGLLEFDEVDGVVERGYEAARPLVEAWCARR